MQVEISFFFFIHSFKDMFWLTLHSIPLYLPHPLRRRSVCSHTETADDEAGCLIRFDPDVRIVIPVVARQDGCACSSYSSCTSNGVEVNPRCGCQDFLGEGSPFCYTQGYCPTSEFSLTFLGAKYRSCEVSPSPPPASFACLDPLFPDQWHHSYLRSTDAWSHTKGAGSTIVVIDDGVQYRHPDLRVSVADSYGWQFSTGSRIGSADDDFARHGTASAGVTSAVRDNGRGGCGIASEATLVAVKLLQNYMETSVDYYFSDDLLVSTLTDFETRDGTVLSNSWGPTDDRRVEGPGILQSYSRIDAAIISFGRNGRKGKGGVVVFAAGNGGEYDNSNDDGFTSHSYTFAVGAIGDDGRRTTYSEPGACIDVVAPSDGGWRSVVTADVVGPAGYDISNWTGTFGGTSAATPMVSAVLALILSVRPELALRDLKRILHTTTTINDPDDESWIRNDHGRLYSPWYGFGQVDALAAVTAAKNWTLLGPSREMCSPEWYGYLPLTAETVVVPFSELERDVDSVDEVRVFVDIEHERRGDVSLVLVSPAATRSVLTFAVPQSVFMQTTSFVGHSYLSHAFSGEKSPRSGWKLEIHDATSRGRLVRSHVCVKGDVLTFPLSPPPSSPQTSPDRPDRVTVFVRGVIWTAVGLLYAGLAVAFWHLSNSPNGVTEREESA